MLSFPVFSWRMNIRIGELFGAQYDYDCLLDDDECLVNKWAFVLWRKIQLFTQFPSIAWLLIPCPIRFLFVFLPKHSMAIHI